MEKSEVSSSLRKRGRYVVAMVLGTALSTLSGAPGTAAVPEATARAVNDMSRYCTTCWRNARVSQEVWPDCTQEVFSRLLERVSPDAWCRVLKDEGEERREFLRAIDAVKKRTQRSRKYSPLADDFVADRNDFVQRERSDKREAVARAAEEVLSARQQQILQLSFEGWSVAEIAGELKAPAERVSDDKYKAIRKLRQHLASAES